MTEVYFLGMRYQIYRDISSGIADSKYGDILAVKIFEIPDLLRVDNTACKLVLAFERKRLRTKFDTLIQFEVCGVRLKIRAQLGCVKESLTIYTRADVSSIIGTTRLN